MKRYEVSLEAIVRKEIFVEASNPDEAEKKAIELFDSIIGLHNEDYVIDSTTVNIECD